MSPLSLFLLPSLGSLSLVAATLFLFLVPCLRIRDPFSFFPFHFPFFLERISILFAPLPLPSDSYLSCRQYTNTPTEHTSHHQVLNYNYMPPSSSAPKFPTYKSMEDNALESSSYNSAANILFQTFGYSHAFTFEKAVELLQPRWIDL